MNLSFRISSSLFININNKEQREKEYEHAEMKLNFYITKQFMNKHFIQFEHLLPLVQKYCYSHKCKVYFIKQFFSFLCPN